MRIILKRKIDKYDIYLFSKVEIVLICRIYDLFAHIQKKLYASEIYSKHANLVFELKVIYG